MLEPEGQPELIVYPPERIDDSGELLPGAPAGSPGVRSWFLGLPPRRRHWSAAAVVALAVLLALGALSHRRPHDHPAVPLPNALSSEPEQQELGLIGRRVNLGDGTPVSLAMEGPLVYTLTRSPARLIALDGRTRLVLNSIKVAEGSELVAYDGQLNRVVTVSTDGVASVVRSYDPLFLNSRGEVTLPTVVTGIASLRGQLWLAATGGLYRIPLAAKAAIRLSAINGPVRAIAADPSRNRVLAVVEDGPPTLIAVNQAGVLEQRSTPELAKVSLAVDVRSIWLGGFGGPKDRKLVRLDPVTLGVTGGSPVESEVGPGAIIWPGEDLVWVRSGASENLACLAANSGAVQARWSGIEGPVVSQGGLAFALGRGYLLMLQTLHTSCHAG